MSNVFQKRLATLLSVKSIVTLVLTGVFAYMAITGTISQGNHCLLLRHSEPEGAGCYPGGRI